MKWVKEGYVKLGGWHARRQTWTILYLGNKAQTEIKKGIVVIVDRDKKNGAVSIRRNAAAAD